MSQSEEPALASNQAPREEDTRHLPNVVVQATDRAPGLLVRVIWFIFVGWWLGQAALLFAWVCNVLILTLPLGLYVLNRLPQIFTLRATRQEWRVEHSEGPVTVVRSVEIPQRDFWLRAV
jgi:hypothetical protein